MIQKKKHQCLPCYCHQTLAPGSQGDGNITNILRTLLQLSFLLFHYFLPEFLLRPHGIKDGRRICSKALKPDVTGEGG